MIRSISLLLLLSPSLLASDPRSTDAKSHEPYTEIIPGSSVEFNLVAIRGGTFHLGSPITEPGRRDNEGPRRKVDLRPFWMGIHEMIWGEFHAYMRETKFDLIQRPETESPHPHQREADAVTKPTASYIDETYGFGSSRYPAFNISHHAAMKYCEWLSAKTGRAYRLPTEAEWEYACRAGSMSAYPFGQDDKSLSEFAWYQQNSPTEAFPRGKTHEVGLKKPNAWGLHDMLGNVAEWCIDEYDADFYDSLPWDKTPLGPVNLPGKNRYPHVARGGSFRSQPVECLSAARMHSESAWNRSDPEDPPSIWWLVPGKWVGFRIVRAVDEYPALVGIKSKMTKERE